MKLTIGAPTGLSRLPSDFSSTMLARNSFDFEPQLIPPLVVISLWSEVMSTMTETNEIKQKHL